MMTADQSYGDKTVTWSTGSRSGTVGNWKTL